MAGVKTPEGGIPKTKQILIALQLDGPMCKKDLDNKFGYCNSLLRNLIKAGCVETYKHFNPYYGGHWGRKEVDFYAATGVPYITKRLPVKNKPHNYARDKAVSMVRIPRYIAYLEKWGYEVTYKGEASELTKEN